MHRETLHPLQSWKIKRKKVISVQERKRASVSVDLGQSEEWRSSPMWMGLSEFGPKHPASGTFFPHTTAENCRPAETIPSPNGSKETVSLLHYQLKRRENSSATQAGTLKQGVGKAAHPAFYGASVCMREQFGTILKTQ